jgi:DNA-binding response OmpR family regulator
MNETSAASIMIVSDNPDFCYLMQRYAQQSVHEAVSALRDDDVLAVAHREKPGAIVLEVGLPDTAGWKLLRALKADPKTTSIPVVLCSWLDDKELGLEQGADVYLCKPVLYEQFLDALGVVGIDRRE